MSIATKLEVEIDDELEALAGMSKGSEDYKATVDGVGKLLDRAIEVERLEREYEEKERARAEEKKDRLIKNCLTAAGILIPTVVTVWGTIVSLNFEKEGTITTGIGRGFINKLLPRK